MAIDEKKLKPCPFCGYHEVAESGKARKGYDAIVSCNCCGAEYRSVYFDNIEEAENDAIESWNRRTSDNDVPDNNVGKMNKEFERLEVAYFPDEFCIYPEYIGKPYFAIRYKENGNHFVGYGTYSPEVLSRYLRDYFMPLAMPKESKWIPCSERLPEENGSYIVTSMDYVDTFEAVFDSGEWFSIDYCDDIKNVIAWMPLPDAYKEKEK